MLASLDILFIVSPMLVYIGRSNQRFDILIQDHPRVGFYLMSHCLLELLATFGPRIRVVVPSVNLMKKSVSLIETGGLRLLSKEYI